MSNRVKNQISTSNSHVVNRLLLRYKIYEDKCFQQRHRVLVEEFNSGFLNK
jgi:hypothetical protein